ncbi:hypothetical protein DPEC_G00257490 [Dallia pectoralis]|uniref:Uncharacterized protein n=1 Tax=Dallia pectoralis TaxID=75939 RepID=A0ACC2FQP0_DALPE|nr:hypothetical protein DPEC_G00257490 [Dallia pectoralis]
MGALCFSDWPEARSKHLPNLTACQFSISHHNPWIRPSSPEARAKPNIFIDLFTRTTPGFRCGSAIFRCKIPFKPSPSCAKHTGAQRGARICEPTITYLQSQRARGVGGEHTYPGLTAVGVTGFTPRSLRLVWKCVGCPWCLARPLFPLNCVMSASLFLAAPGFPRSDAEPRARGEDGIPVSGTLIDRTERRGSFRRDERRGGRARARSGRFLLGFHQERSSVLIQSNI